jgi:hypothetical protein
MFGPRAAILASARGPLIACDTGHHRVLIWNEAPGEDGTPADVVIGQADFTSESRNAGREPGPATLHVPTGVATEGGLLAVADAWNHRVLLWHRVPTRPNEPADIVLGQPDFSSALANRGCVRPAAGTLNWCYGVATHGGRLFVADTGNRRVLVWNQVPAANGAPADLVLGQPDFTTRDQDAGSDSQGMRWPHAVATTGDMLFVADAGSSRVMVWSRVPRRNGVACDFVLGQQEFHDRDHNRGHYEAGASTLNMPYGLCILSDQLVIADTANSRLLGFDLASVGMVPSAQRLTGQPTFIARGDNRWGEPSRESLCWPYAVSSCGTTLVIADTGNNRVLLWDTP